MYRLPLLICLVTFVICLFSKNILAQDLSSGLAISVPIEGETISGDLICSTGTSFTRCVSEYQSGIYGVVVDSSSLEISDSELTNPQLVTTSGIVTVRVTNANGEIKSGNFLTSSGEPGVAQLATKNGYVLGTALEDFNGETGVIQAVINIGLTSSISTSTSSNLIQFIREGLTVPVFEPLESFRYILAALMVLVAFTLGLLFFGRSSRAGIEAIGRNPLAKNVIQFNTVLNILLTIVIVAVGLGISYFILVF